VALARSLVLGIPSVGKPFKRCRVLTAQDTGLKPGENEKRSEHKAGDDSDRLDGSMSLIDWLHRLFSVTEGNTPYASDEDNRDPDGNSDPYNPFPELVEIAITDVIDLHTIPPRDVARVVEEYLRLTHEAGLPVVRIIHGKGIGVQRTIVRSILAKTAFVVDWTDAPHEAGGLGATIVRLNHPGF